MWQKTVSIDLNVPPERVYAYLADFTRHTEWSSNVRRIELKSGTAGQVGAVYEAFESVPRELTSFARITALRSPTLIEWESTDYKVFRTNWSVTIEPVGAGSRLTQSVIFHPLNLFANVILYLFRVPVVEKENRASLERIKTILEK
jgi:Polyketide cyclase / dehydrase and lipid transport